MLKRGYTLQLRGRWPTHAKPLHFFHVLHKKKSACLECIFAFVIQHSQLALFCISSENRSSHFKMLLQKHQINICISQHLKDVMAMVENDLSMTH